MSRKPFSCIVSDPGWSFRDNLPGPGRGARKHYKCMRIGDIIELHKQLLGYKEKRRPFVPGSYPVADTSWMFLWRVASMQNEALLLARSLGFTVKSEIVWVKTPKLKTGDQLSRAAKRYARSQGLGDDAQAVAAHAGFLGTEEGHRVKEGMGHYVRLAHETCLICTRGTGVSALRLSKSIPSVIFAPLGDHSEKPDEFYEIVERLCKGPRLELFARKRRSGWTQFGDELQAAEAAE